MAEQSGSDIRVHQETWHHFTLLTKWAAVAIIIVLSLMATFLL
jgi:hypothetical protein